MNVIKLFRYEFISYFRRWRIIINLPILLFFSLIFRHNTTAPKFNISFFSSIFIYLVTFLNLDIMWDFFNKKYEFPFLIHFPFKRKEIFIAKWVSLLFYFGLFLLLFLITTQFRMRRIFIEPFIYTFLELIIFLNIITIFSFSRTLYLPLFAFIFFNVVAILLRANLFSYNGYFREVYIIIGLLLPPLNSLIIHSLSIFDVFSLAIYVFLLFILAIYYVERYEFS